MAILDAPIIIFAFFVACVLLILEFVLLYLILRLYWNIRRISEGVKSASASEDGITSITRDVADKESIIFNDAVESPPMPNVPEIAPVTTTADDTLSSVTSVVETPPTKPELGGRVGKESAAASPHIVQKTCKEQVIEAIRKRREVEEADLPHVKKELLDYFYSHRNGDYSKDVYSRDYYRLLDLSYDTSARIVVVGDLHSDFHSLVAMLLKLSVSNYDYFEHAYFVFLGDYLDRGGTLFEPLLLLKDLQGILGKRMILLKGNHESIYFDLTRQELKSSVRPHESSTCLNQYCGDDKQFLREFATFYSSLPVYVYLKSGNRNILLAHAAIPRDVFLHTFHFDENDGSIVFEPSVSHSEYLLKRNIILNDMIWGDPKECDKKIQVEGRFEYGRHQFNQFAHKNRLHLMLRSHEEAAYGSKSFFDKRLFTIFSTGGVKNPVTGYPHVEPAFGILQTGCLSLENSYLFQVRTKERMAVVNFFSECEFSEKQTADFDLQREFACGPEESARIREIFKNVKAAFHTG